MPRVDYEALLDSLRYPLVWSYDRWFQAWLPAEVDHAFLKWLSVGRLDGSPARYDQLMRAGLLEHDGRMSWEEAKARFDRDGYVRLPRFLAPAFARTLLPLYLRNDHLHQRHHDMEGIIRTSVNNLPLMRLLHQATERLVSYVAPERLKTSYSFSSAYESGSILPRHTDRPQCAYNISLMLGSSPLEAPMLRWPLFIERNGAEHEIPLDAGDAVLYSGVRDPHWRDEMPAELKLAFGVFFHYVPIDFQGNLN